MTLPIQAPPHPVPKWDVALEALSREESLLQNRPLQLDDFLRLAKTHAIRFDDIMVTLFELVLNQRWRYTSKTGVVTPITRDEVNHLYVNGRINEDDVRHYDGFWSPN
ncbi:MAG: hypothetical protein FD130_2354 [Halothiobacillaceae bacterium]|nr:MAG: hypothetical protein FD130_2354 [Halothiobacillaceae bacterium]